VVSHQRVEKSKNYFDQLKSENQNQKLFSGTFLEFKRVKWMILSFFQDFRIFSEKKFFLFFFSYSCFFGKTERIFCCKKILD